MPARLNLKDAQENVPKENERYGKNEHFDTCTIYRGSVKCISASYIQVVLDNVYTSMTTRAPSELGEHNLQAL